MEGLFSEPERQSDEPHTILLQFISKSHTEFDLRDAFASEPEDSLGEDETRDDHGSCVSFTDAALSRALGRNLAGQQTKISAPPVIVEYNDIAGYEDAASDQQTNLVTRQYLDTTAESVLHQEVDRQRQIYDDDYFSDMIEMVSLDDSLSDEEQANFAVILSTFNPNQDTSYVSAEKTVMKRCELLSDSLSQNLKKKETADFRNSDESSLASSLSPDGVSRHIIDVAPSWLDWDVQQSVASFADSEKTSSAKLGLQESESLMLSFHDFRSYSIEGAPIVRQKESREMISSESGMQNSQGPTPSSSSLSSRRTISASPQETASDLASESKCTNVSFHKAEANIEFQGTLNNQDSKLMADWNNLLNFQDREESNEFPMLSSEEEREFIKWIPVAQTSYLPALTLEEIADFVVSMHKEDPKLAERSFYEKWSKKNHHCLIDTPNSPPHGDVRTFNALSEWLTLALLSRNDFSTGTQNSYNNPIHFDASTMEPKSSGNELTTEPSVDLLRRSGDGTETSAMVENNDDVESVKSLLELVSSSRELQTSENPPSSTLDRVEVLKDEHTLSDYRNKDFLELDALVESSSQSSKLSVPLVDNKTLTDAKKVHRSDEVGTIRTSEAYKRQMSEYASEDPREASSCHSPYETKTQCTDTYVSGESRQSIEARQDKETSISKNAEESFPICSSSNQVHSIQSESTTTQRKGFLDLRYQSPYKWKKQGFSKLNPTLLTVEDDDPSEIRVEMQQTSNKKQSDRYRLKWLSLNGLRRTIQRRNKRDCLRHKEWKVSPKVATRPGRISDVVPRKAVRFKDPLTEVHTYEPQEIEPERVSLLRYYIDYIDDSAREFEYLWPLYQDDDDLYSDDEDSIAHAGFGCISDGIEEMRLMSSDMF